MYIKSNIFLKIVKWRCFDDNFHCTKNGEGRIYPITIPHIKRGQMLRKIDLNFRKLDKSSCKSASVDILRTGLLHIQREIKNLHNGHATG